jgi:hypothetical protein
MANSRNKQFVNCKLQFVLSNTMKSCTTLHPTLDVTLPSVHHNPCCTHSSPASHQQLTQPCITSSMFK